MRLIDADALEVELHNFFDGKIIDEPAYILRDVFCYIDGAPTIAKCGKTSDGLPLMDLRPRPQGEWVTTKVDTDLDDTICSICGKSCEDIEGTPHKTSFCPNCGADMRGVE